MFTWEAKWTHTGLRYQTSVKTNSIHITFHFGCISKQPNILMDMHRYLITGSVYMILYHPKWNFISVKMTQITPAMSFKCTSALNSISNESTLIHFVLANFIHMKISCQFEDSFRSKWPIWNPYQFEFHFTSIHMNTSKELTEHQSEIFNWNEISYQLEFISPLMWTYS